MKRLNAAWEVLGVADRRAEYDRSRGTTTAGPNGSSVIHAAPQTPTPRQPAADHAGEPADSRPARS